jgi:hypothetical protein
MAGLYIRTLDELADWLRYEDMRPDLSVETTFGAGRNVTTFDELRQIAYREVLGFKRAGDLAAWIDRCQHVATGINQQFPQPLRYSEVRSIVRSVSRWTWRHFSEQAFSQHQSWRGKRGNAKRWAGHVPAEKTKPWEDCGLSRAAHYRRKKAGTLPALNSPLLGETIAISDNSPLGGLPALPALCPRPPMVAPNRPRWPHLRRQDGFGRIPLDQRWAQPMRAFAAARRAPFLRVAA